MAKRNGIALFIALLVILTASATAQAQTSVQDPASWSDIQNYVRVGEQYTAGPCTNRVQVNLVDYIPKEEDDNLPNATVQGRAHINDGSCLVDMVNGLSKYNACVVLAHEIRHLQGYVSPDPYVDPSGEVDRYHDKGGLMAPDITDVEQNFSFEPCNVAVPPVLTRDATLTYLDAHWMLNTYDCRRDTISTQHCWGTTPMGRKMTFTVEMNDARRIQGRKVSATVAKHTRKRHAKRGHAK